MMKDLKIFIDLDIKKFSISKFFDFNMVYTVFQLLKHNKLS